MPNFYLAKYIDKEIEYDYVWEIKNLKLWKNYYSYYFVCQWLGLDKIIQLDEIIFVNGDTIYGNVLEIGVKEI